MARWVEASALLFGPAGSTALVLFAGDAAMTSEPLDLGDGHRLYWVGWSPDRALNPQYADMPDIERIGAIVEHLDKQGQVCPGYVGFDVPGVERFGGDRQRWKIESMEPLTLSPSIECKKCKDHGYIRNGRWEAC